MDNAPSVQVFQLMDEHAMADPVGGANEDGDDGINRGALGSATEHEYCTTTGLRGTTHGDGDDEFISDTSIGNGTHLSKPELTNTNCHEPWIDGPELKRRDLFDCGSCTLRSGI
jgi:hypothetical protein